MPPFARLILATLTLLVAAPAFAGERSVTLAVENIGCIACAPIVESVLSKLPGISEVVFAEQGGVTTATVSFDDGRVTPEEMAIAVTNAGFPAQVRTN